MTVYVHTRESVKAIPAVLLKPKVPKTKGKILLERIKPLWQKLSFIQKLRPEISLDINRECL